MEKMSKTGPVALRRSPGFSMPLPIPMVNTPTEDPIQSICEIHVCSNFPIVVPTVTTWPFSNGLRFCKELYPISVRILARTSANSAADIIPLRLARLARLFRQSRLLT